MTWGRYRVCFDLTAPVIVIDFETTGLSSRRHQITEIGALRLLPGEANAPIFHRLIRQPRKLPASIVTLTGITDDLLARDGVEGCDALRDLVEFIGSAPVVTYNTAFDLGFLNAACEQHSVQVPRRGGHSCALRLARKVWPGLPSYRLPDLSARFGFGLDGTHRAVGDAVRAAQVYRIASADYHNRKISSATRTWSEHKPDHPKPDMGQILREMLRAPR